MSGLRPSKLKAGIDWEQFSIGCFVLAMASLLVVIVLFVHWFTTTPDVGFGSIAPTYLRVAIMGPITFGFIGCGGLLLAFRKQMRDC